MPKNKKQKKLDVDKNNAIEFKIGDKVRLVSDTKNRTYTIYSYTTYANWRVNYTCWFDDEYDMYEPWQIQPYTPDIPMGFITNEIIKQLWQDQ